MLDRRHDPVVAEDRRSGVGVEPIPRIAEPGDSIGAPQDCYFHGCSVPKRRGCTAVDIVAATPVTIGGEPSTLEPRVDARAGPPTISVPLGV